NLKYRFPGDTLSVMDCGEMARPDIQLSTLVHGNIYGALRNELEHFVELINNQKIKQAVPIKDALIGIKKREPISTADREGKNRKIYGELRNELEHYVELINNQKIKQAVQMKDAVLGIKICEALITSAREGKEIIWDR